LKVELLHDYDHWRAAALLQAAFCYEQMQAPDQAIRTYQQLIDQFPQFKQQQTAEQRLQALRQTGSQPTAAVSSTRS
jgi:TolA-binding protein